MRRTGDSAFAAAHFIKISRRGRVYAKKISRRMRRTEAIQRSAAHFIKISRRGRVYAKKYRGERGEREIQRSPAGVLLK